MLLRSEASTSESPKVLRELPMYICVNNATPGAEIQAAWNWGPVLG